MKLSNVSLLAFAATIMFQFCSFQLLPAEQNSSHPSTSRPSLNFMRGKHPTPRPINPASFASKNEERDTEKKHSQHAPIPPKALRGNVQAATDGAPLIVRPPHVDDQHRGDFHREDHLRALLGHDSCFQSGRWEGGVPWLLFLLLLRLVLLGDCHCGIFWE